MCEVYRARAVQKGPKGWRPPRIRCTTYLLYELCEIVEGIVLGNNNRSAGDDVRPDLVRPRICARNASRVLRTHRLPNPASALLYTLNSDLLIPWVSYRAHITIIIYYNIANEYLYLWTRYAYFMVDLTVSYNIIRRITGDVLKDF